MSTLVTNTITGLSTAANITIGSTPVVSASANSLTIRGEGSAQTSVQQGLTKVWCSGASDGASIQDSFNVSSMADTATGVQTPSIANDMVNNDYSVFSCCNNDTLICPNVKGIGTGVYSAKMQAPDGTDTDVVMASTVHGDLA